MERAWGAYREDRPALPGWSGTRGTRMARIVPAMTRVGAA